VGYWHVIYLERGADLHTAQWIPLPLTDSCFSKIQIGFTFLVPAHLGCSGQRAVKLVCVCVCVCACVGACVRVCVSLSLSLLQNSGHCNSFHCLGHFKNVYDDDDDAVASRPL